MTEREYEDRRFDAHALLGSAAHLIRRMAHGDAASAQRMAVEWTEAYARYTAGGRAALPWVTGTGFEGEVR